MESSNTAVATKADIADIVAILKDFMGQVSERFDAIAKWHLHAPTVPQKNYHRAEASPY